LDSELEKVATKHNMPDPNLLTSLLVHEKLLEWILHDNPYSSEQTTVVNLGTNK